MIAIIEIPHQTPARLHWYEDQDAVIDAAWEYAGNSDRPEPKTFDDALACLADDWSDHLLVESADDIQWVEKYQGHQAHRIHPMVDELREALTAATRQR